MIRYHRIFVFTTPFILLHIHARSIIFITFVRFLWESVHYIVERGSGLDDFLFLRLWSSKQNLSNSRIIATSFPNEKGRKERVEETKTTTNTEKVNYVSCLQPHDSQRKRMLENNPTITTQKKKKERKEGKVEVKQSSIDKIRYLERILTSEMSVRGVCERVSLHHGRR